MLMNTRKQESGIILIALLFVVVIAIFGYVVINSISKSREADQIKDTTGDAIESANDAVDSVNDAADKANNLIN